MIQTRYRSDLAFAAFGVALIACAAAFAIWGTPPLPPAPIVLLGIPSPLTGMTRSFVALARGHVLTAFAFHPLGPICFIACVVAVVSFASVAVKRRRPRFVVRLLAIRSWGWIVAAVFLIVWIRQIVVYH